MSFIERVFKPGAVAGWVALDVSPHQIAAVSVLAPSVAGAKPKVVAFGKSELSDAGDGAFAQALQSVAQKVHLSGAGWTVVLDRSSYNVYVIDEPAVRPDEMDQSIRWAVSSMIDYSVEDASVAWMKIPTEQMLPNRTPHIYVVISRKSVVEHYRQEFKGARLNLRAVDIRETSHRNLASLVAKQNEGLPFLTIGPRGVLLTVSYNGELYLDRHMDEMLVGGGVDESGTERSLERVVLQIQRSLDFLGRTLPFLDVSRVVLSPFAGVSGLRDYFAENLPISLEVLDLSEVFDLSQTPQLSSEEVAGDYIFALGAALRYLDRVS